MKNTYRTVENIFEKIAGVGMMLFSNSLVFILAVVLVLFWLIKRDWHNTTITDGLRDIILAITFLSFFIIQKIFSHFSRVLNLKLNELVAAHENARNHVIRAEDKSEDELKELAKDHEKIAKDIRENESDQ